MIFSSVPDYSKPVKRSLRDLGCTERTEGNAKIGKLKVAFLLYLLFLRLDIHFDNLCLLCVTILSQHIWHRTRLIFNELPLPGVTVGCS